MWLRVLLVATLVIVSHTLLSFTDERDCSSGSTELVFLRLDGRGVERASERDVDRERDLLLLFLSPRRRRGGVNERLLDLRECGEGERRLGALSRRGRGGEALRERERVDEERSRLGRRRLGDRERENDLSSGEMGLSRLLTRSGDLLVLLKDRRRLRLDTGVRERERARDVTGLGDRRCRRRGGEAERERERDRLGEDFADHDRLGGRSFLRLPPEGL